MIMELFKPITVDSILATFNQAIVDLHRLDGTLEVRIETETARIAEATIARNAARDERQRAQVVATKIEHLISAA